MYTYTHIGLFLFLLFSVYSNGPFLPLLPTPFPCCDCPRVQLLANRARACVCVCSWKIQNAAANCEGVLCEVGGNSLILVGCCRWGRGGGAALADTAHVGPPPVHH